MRAASSSGKPPTPVPNATSASDRAPSSSARRSALAVARRMTSAEVERATVAMEDVRRIKSQLTGAAGQIDEAYKTVGAMADRVRGHLAQIDEMVAAAGGEDD